AVQGLTDDQLDTPYRPDGWTVRQVVHHVPDSHLNSYVRFKWALTETEPLIKTYDQDGWSTLPDARTASIEMSLILLDAIHERWLALLQGLSEDDFARTFKHPEWGLVRLDQNLAIYAWHGKHHVAHIMGLRERKGW
ncbi:MAG TPA: putative metal-dependent hydrolase, partial [Rhodothermales bacterium]|nr:putative metal-dependent hydrolase [Rhodothermales bacterium]